MRDIRKRKHNKGQGKMPLACVIEGQLKRNNSQEETAVVTPRNLHASFLCTTKSILCLLSRLEDPLEVEIGR
jgi:hypothetical protein